MNKKLIKFLKISSVLVVLIYLGICTLLYVKQDDLLFHPKPISKTDVIELLKNNPGFDTLSFVMNDNIKISLYVSKDSSNHKWPILIYFGGNAEEVSHLMEKKSYFKNLKFVLVNYRSFGLSQGVISEKNMFSDALEIYDYLKTRKDIDFDNMNVLGRSIGTGVATYLSSQRNVKSTVLITPYESMIDVAQEKYPFVPIGWLINHPFNSKKYAVSINSKMLAVISKNDVVIPKQHAYNLIKAWKGKVVSKEYEEDHSSIMQNEACWNLINEFISH
jgi:hypothetical protein